MDQTKVHMRDLQEVGVSIVENDLSKKFQSEEQARMFKKMQKLFHKAREGEEAVSVVAADSKSINLILAGSQPTTKKVLVAVISENYRICIGHFGGKHVFVSSNPQKYSEIQLVIRDKKHGDNHYYVATGNHLSEFVVGEKQNQARTRVLMYAEYTEKLDALQSRMFDTTAFPFQEADLFATNRADMASFKVVVFGYLLELFPELKVQLQESKVNDAYEK